MNILREHTDYQYSEGVAMICCLFGHKDTPSSIYPELEVKIKYVIEHEAVDYFLVGNNGSFDSMALSILRNIVHEYPGVSFHIVLAYMPMVCKPDWPYSVAETLYPEGLESVHPRYAIAWRNSWMVQTADIVLCYIKHDWGGAARYVALAQKKKKRVINIGLLMTQD